MLFLDNAIKFCLMPYWKPLSINGLDIDLSHLEPFTFSLLPKGWKEEALVRVSFNNHCFSEEFKKDIHGTPLPPSHVSRHETRGFDQLRYDLSKSLPRHIRGLDGRRIAQTRTATLVRLTTETGLTYGIFFSLKKRDRALCEMIVMSAYPLERATNSVAATGEMKFNVAVAKVLEGKKLKFPSGRF